jgi:hypothetical protein
VKNKTILLFRLSKNYLTITIVVYVEQEHNMV